MDHLPKMLNSYYIVDGVKSQFVDYERDDESQTIRLILTVRPYNYKYAEMPEILQHWEPTNHGAFLSFDHIKAENETLIPEKSNNSYGNVGKPISPKETMNMLFLNFMEKRLTGSGELDRKLDETLINLKNKDHVDQNQINKAKAINELLKTSIANSKLNLELFAEARKFFNIDDENENL